MIKQTVNFEQFCDSFSDTYKGNFTYNGKRALFDYLENLSEDIEVDIELDPIALCCEYKEYKDLAELQENYTDIKSMAELEEKTQVIPIEGTEGFIILQF